MTRQQDVEMTIIWHPAGEPPPVNKCVLAYHSAMGKAVPMELHERNDGTIEWRFTRTDWKYPGLRIDPPEWWCDWPDGPSKKR